MMTNSHILTIDVEDNFTINELTHATDWDIYQNQVVENTQKIIELLLSHNASATFFIVGKVAERHPELVEAIAKNNFEVASHSYSHIPLHNLNESDLRKEIQKGSEILEQITGNKVQGFRAMGYSIPDNPDIFYSLLKEFGYSYDSSCKYPLVGNETISTTNSLTHIYTSFFTCLHKRISFSGGTYLRFLPLQVIRYGMRSYIARQQPAMVYVHPWEFNKNQPQREISIKQKILQHPITFNTERKLKYLLKNFKFISIKNYLGR